MKISAGSYGGGNGGGSGRTKSSGSSGSSRSGGGRDERGNQLEILVGGEDGEERRDDVPQHIPTTNGSYSTNQNSRVIVGTDRSMLEAPTISTSNRRISKIGVFFRLANFSLMEVPKLKKIGGKDKESSKMGSDNETETMSSLLTSQR